MENLAGKLMYMTTFVMHLKKLQEQGVAIKWGAAWSECDIRTYEGTAEDAINNYIDLRRSQVSRPFIDWPHFELM